MSQEIVRASTGIPRLDAALEGGIPRGTWVAVTGEPGTGKSILCMHFAWAGLKSGDPVIYVTTEAEFKDVIRQARQFKMYFDDYEVHYLGGRPPVRRPQLVVIDIFSLLKTAKQLTATSEEIESSRRYAALEIDVLIAAINEAYRVLDLIGEGRRSPRRHVRLIIDSMSAFWADKPAMARRYSYQLKIATHRENVTALLVSQYAMTTKSVDYLEPIVVRVGDEVRTACIGDFVDSLLKHSYSSEEVAVKQLASRNIYTLTVDPGTGLISWGKVEAVIRHRERRCLRELIVGDGGRIRVTEDHSVYVVRSNKLVPVKASSISVGDLLPVLKSSGIGFERVRSVELVEPSTEYVYDLSVKPNENFIAGTAKALAHNSTFGFGLEHIADGVIHLWMDDVESAKEIRRYLIIKKMRMTNHYTRALRVNIVPGEGMRLDLI